MHLAVTAHLPTGQSQSSTSPLPHPLFPATAVLPLGTRGHVWTQFWLSRLGVLLASSG